MLTNRSDRTHSGQKLSVGVAYPKRHVLRHLVRRLTLGGAIAGAALGFGHAVFISGAQGDLTMAHLALEVGLCAGGGAVAGLVGSLAYAFVGGAPGAALGLLGAAAVGGGSFAAFPSLASMPRALTSAETGVTDSPLSTKADVSQISTDSDLRFRLRPSWALSSRAKPATPTRRFWATTPSKKPRRPPRRFTKAPSTTAWFIWA